MRSSIVRFLPLPVKGIMHQSHSAEFILFFFYVLRTTYKILKLLFSAAGKATKIDARPGPTCGKLQLPFHSNYLWPESNKSDRIIYFRKSDVENQTMKININDV
jgi:hypothetical protein